MPTPEELEAIKKNELLDFKQNFAAIKQKTRNGILSILYNMPIATMSEFKDRLANTGVVGRPIKADTKKKEAKLTLPVIHYHLRILINAGLVTKQEFPQTQHREHYATHVARAKGYTLTGKGKTQYEAYMGIHP